MSERVNVYADRTFQIDIEVPEVTTGMLGAPSLGAITNVKLRLSAAKFGAAIHADVGNLAALERSEQPGRFYFEVDTALLVTHVKPLGVGTYFYAVWSRGSAFDMEAFEYVVSDGTLHK